MQYIFYADVYFFQNSIIKIVVLFITLCIQKHHAIKWNKNMLVKIIVLSCLATMIEIIMLFTNVKYECLRILFVLFEVPIILRILLPKTDCKLFKLCLIAYFYLMLVNGAVELLWNWLGKNANYIYILILACGVVIVGVRMYSNYLKMQKGVYEVTLLHKENTLQANGFYDSGNCLKDPYTGLGVHIVSEDALNRLGVIDEKETITPVYVTYQALGNSFGMIEVYYLDEIRIHGEKDCLIQKKYPVGVAKDNLFNGKNYEIILNEEVF